MKITTTLLLALGLVCTSTYSAWAAFNVDRNGHVWPATFEGDDFPEFSTPPWAFFDNNGFASESSDGNIFSIVSGSVGVTASYTMADSSWNTGTTVRTVEFRARVPDDQFLALDGAAAVTLGVNGTAYDFRLYPTKIAFNGSNINGGVLDPVNIVELDLTQFRTFRVTVDQNRAEILKLYVDNDPTPALSSNDFWFNSPGFDRLNFGDTSTGGMSGKSDWDFISWDATAAVDFPAPPLTSDFDDDGYVDGHDFLIWQRGFGLTGQTDNSQGDADGNGTVNGNDLLLWQAEFGSGPSPSMAIAAVPEPSSVLLFAISIGVWACTRRL